MGKRGRPPLDSTLGPMSVAERKRKQRGRADFRDTDDEIVILKVDERVFELRQRGKPPFRFTREFLRGQSVEELREYLDRKILRAWVEDDVPLGDPVDDPFAFAAPYLPRPVGSTQETHHPPNAMQLALVLGPQSVRQLQEFASRPSKFRSGGPTVSHTVTTVTGRVFKCPACGYRWESEAVRSRCPRRKCKTKVSIFWHEQHHESLEHLMNSLAESRDPTFKQRPVDLYRKLRDQIIMNSLEEVKP